MFVLIISTKEDDVRLIRESLPSVYQVKTAESVKNALDLQRQYAFDVIFSDLKLLQDASDTANIDEAIKPFKEMNPLAEVLILSSKAFIHDTVKAVKAGASNYLTYPINPAEVRLAIESVNESLCIPTAVMIRLPVSTAAQFRTRFWKASFSGMKKTLLKTEKCSLISSDLVE